MGKEFSACLYGISTGLVSGSAVTAHAGRKMLVATAIISFVLGTIAYVSEKRVRSNSGESDE